MLFHLSSCCTLGFCVFVKNQTFAILGLMRCLVGSLLNCWSLIWTCFLYEFLWNCHIIGLETHLLLSISLTLLNLSKFDFICCCFFEPLEKTTWFANYPLDLLWIQSRIEEKQNPCCLLFKSSIHRFSPHMDYYPTVSLKTTWATKHPLFFYEFNPNLWETQKRLTLLLKSSIYKFSPHLDHYWIQ